MILIYEKTYSDIIDEVKQSKFNDRLEYIEVNDFINSYKTYTDKSERLLVCAGLDDIKKIIEIIANENKELAIVPYEDQATIRNSFELPSKIEDVLELSLYGKAQPIDLLYCNEKLVLFSAIIGDAPPLSYRSSSYINKSFLERLKLLVKSFKKLKSLKQSKITIKTQKDKEIKTAASGIVAIEHDNQTCAYQVIKDSILANDGKITALLVSPASVVQYIGFLIKAFFSLNNKNILPESVGYIKSPTLDIESKIDLNIEIDGTLSQTTPAHFRIKEKALSICAGDKFWQRHDKDKDEKESIKLNRLPTSSEGVDYLQKKIPLFTHASENEFRTLFSSLRDDGQANSTFFILMLLSTLLATVGLFLNSASVVIGAMLLAPLMQPIVSFSMGMLRRDQKLLYASLTTTVLGVLLVIFSAAFVTVLLPFEIITSEISARLRPSLLDLIVAVVSGVAAAYAKSNEKIVQSLAGVAIAVALVPPLSTAGIGLGWLNFDIFYSAFLLFLTNFVGIVFAAAITFLILGFSPVKIARKGLIAFIAIVFFVSIPLYLSFSQMAEDAKILKTLQNIEFYINDRKVILEDAQLLHQGDILVIRGDIITEKMLNTQKLRMIKSQIKEKTGQDIKLEIVQRVRF